MLSSSLGLIVSGVTPAVKLDSFCFLRFVLYDDLQQKISNCRSKESAFKRHTHLRSLISSNAVAVHSLALLTTFSDTKRFTLQQQQRWCIMYLYQSFLDFFSARCNIYISRLCYDVSVRLSVRLFVTEVHWRIIANLGFKFRSKFTAHCGHGDG